ncbi:MAG: delta-class carbonic anhydrase [Hydrogenophaga sp.]
MKNPSTRAWLLPALSLVSVAALAGEPAGHDAHAGHAAHGAADAATIEAQNAALERNTDGKGFGPQSPRDLSRKAGANVRVFMPAPAHTQMNLCNIHFHENAEHKGGEFTVYAGPGDGHGYGSGYRYAGHLTAQESRPLADEVCKSAHGGLQAGDTIELHYVFSTAQVQPGPTLNACLSESGANPQLRVEAQVMVLVNDAKAADFNQLTRVGVVQGFQQPLNMPTRMGEPIRYAGSTTGPTYNEKGSPLQVTWSVRPKVLKVNVESVGQWCKANAFNEDHAHGVRNLVINPKLLSKM